MRNMLLSIVALVSVLEISSPMYADQAPWGPVTGRTASISVVRKQFGDINASISLNLMLPDSKRVFDVDVQSNSVSLNLAVPIDASVHSQFSARCAGSWDSTCAGLDQINSCDFNSLSTAAKSALSLTLGSCQKSCFVALSQAQNGESITLFSWSCANPSVANCVTVAGTLAPTLERIDLIESGLSCDF